MGGLRVSVGIPVRGIRLSAESELNLSGRVTGKRYVLGDPLGPYVIYREGRRDLLSSFLGGVQMWEPHHVGSVHIVAGMTHVNPHVTAEARSVWSDDRLDVPANYRSTWAATIGVDLLLRFGRVSAGPTYRWHDYLSNVSSRDIGRPTRAALLGLAASFHF